MTSPSTTTSRHGARNPNARLTPEAVRWVRESHRQGRSIAEMARELGVHHSTVSDVVNGVSWKESACRVARNLTFDLGGEGRAAE